MTVITAGVPPSLTAIAGTSVKKPAKTPASGGSSVPSTGQIWPR